jgi:transposase
MSDEALAEQSTRDLIALIRRLEEQLAVVTAQLAAAQARNAELEAELARRGGPPKTPQNSSTPPSQGWKREGPPTGAAGAKRGRPVGHPGTSRRRAAPDWVVLCQPTHCAGCGQELTDRPQARVGVSQVVELPPVQPVVFEAWRYVATCAHCGTTTAAQYPAGFEPTRVFGPRLEVLWTYLHEQHHVGYARLARLGWELWHLRVSQGALVNVLGRVAQRLAPQAAAIREQVRASPIIGSDETSARVNGRTHWQWVFQTPTASYHVIRPRRNGAVVPEFLGDAVPETWVSDLYRPQLNAGAARHQICLTHQLRELQYVVDKEDSAWARDCQQLFRLAIHRAHQRDAGSCGVRPTRPPCGRSRGCATRCWRPRWPAPKPVGCGCAFGSIASTYSCSSMTRRCRPPTTPRNRRCGTRWCIARSPAASARTGARKLMRS